MPNESGELNQADVAQLDRFLGRQSPDMCMTCPLTGERIPIVRWKITKRLCLMPTMGSELVASKDYVAMLQMTSPAGGVVLLNAVAIGLISVARVN